MSNATPNTATSATPAVQSFRHPVFDSQIAAVEEVFRDEGWTLCPGRDDVWEKEYPSIGRKKASAFLHVWESENILLVRFSFQSEGRNVCAANTAYIERGAPHWQATAAAMKALYGAERDIRGSFGYRYAEYA